MRRLSEAQEEAPVKASLRPLTRCPAGAVRAAPPERRPPDTFDATGAGFSLVEVTKPSLISHFWQP